MSLSFLFGLFSLGAVLYFGVFKSSQSAMIFFDPKAMIMVFGGTLAVAILSFQSRAVMRIVEFVLWGVLFRRKRKYLKAANDMALVRLNFLSGRAPVVDPEYDPLLKEGVEFLFEKSISSEGLVELLKTRAGYFSRFYKEDARILQSLAKYPPALGLLGAAIGMMEMIQGLGATGMGGLANGMVTALLSIFWGVSFANFILLPLADAALKAAHEDAMFRDLIIDGFFLIREGVSDQQFRGHLRGYLSLEDRQNFHVLEANSKISSAVKTEKKEKMMEVESSSRLAPSASNLSQIPQAPSVSQTLQTPQAPPTPRVVKSYVPPVESEPEDYKTEPLHEVPVSKQDEQTEVLEPEPQAVSVEEEGLPSFPDEYGQSKEGSLNFTDFSRLRKRAK